MQSELLVPFATLPTFLKERLKVPQKWPSLIAQVLNKLDQIRNTESFHSEDLLPAKELLNQLDEKPMTYIEVEQMCEILLKSEEAGQKTFLGGYKSQTIKDWLNVQKEFQKENIHVAHSATVLIRIVQYDLPSVKREIKSNEKAITEALNKLESLHKSEQTALSTFAKECGQVSTLSETELISALRLKISEQIKDLVPIYRKVEQALQKPEFKECLNYQEQYLLFFEMEEGIETREPSLLRYFSQHGNTTLAFKAELKNKKMSKVLTQRVKDLQTRKYEVYSVQTAQPKAELVDSSESWEIVNLEEGQEGKDKPENMQEELQECRTILGCVETRKMLTAELTALEAFLESRIFQLQPSRDPESFAVYEQGKPDLLGKQSIEYVRKLLKPVNTALQTLRSAELRHLHRVETDSTYIDEILNKTLKHRDSAKKFREKGEIVEQRIEVLRKELMENKRQASKLKERKQELFTRLQIDVQKLFPGVNIVILL